MTSPRSTRPDQPGETGLPDHPGAGPFREGSLPAQSPGAARDDPSLAYLAGSDAEHARFEPEFARNAWPAFMAAAIGGVAIGIVLLVWPKATLTIVAVLIGASLILAGLLRLIDGFTASDASGGKRVAHVLIGLLAVIAGLYCIRHYHVTIAALAVVVGLFWVLHGIADIAAGLLGGPASGRVLAVLSGVLSLAAGLIVLFWPTISITVLVAVMGIWLVIYGLIMGVTAVSLRRRGDAAPEEADLAPA
jgi:uncharacterized membrane protein HdeD (DUF308 family)